MKRKTFTLIELVIIIALVIILAGISFRPLAQLYRSWQLINQRMPILWGSHFAMQDMAVNIRMVKDRNSIIRARRQRFQFIDTDGNPVNYRFYLDEGVLRKNGDVLIDDVTAGSFYYYDDAQNGVGTGVSLEAPNESAIRYVQVNLTLANGNESITSQVDIKCRNLE